jgi:Phage portal protein, SPP1 Gp6-like
MIVDAGDVPRIASQILRLRQNEQNRLRHIAKYMEGKHDPPYAPKGVNAEYRWIMRKSRRNFLPLIVSVISQNLHVDGYKPGGATTVETVSSALPEPAWSAFESNRMISRQHGVHRAVIEYGAAYVLVLPGELATDEELPGTKVPVLRPVSPRRMTALYADEVDDEWPQVAIEVRVVNNAANPDQSQLLVALYDENARYILAGKPGIIIPQSQNDLIIAEVDNPILNGQPPIAYHNLGICPVVRFLYETDLDGDRDCQGEIEPIMPLQDQINFTTFNSMMAEQYQAFRQRWVTGMAPVDVEGREQAPFRPGVDRVWAAEDATTKFGEFSEAQLGQYLDDREASIRHMSTITQVPPYHLLGQIANLSAEALAAARDGLDRKVDELESNLTDPWRNVFRLTALASDDKQGWDDTNGQVVWRDTSARAFGATIDGLGKAATMLGVPVEELWRRIPGTTADEVNSWLRAKQQEEAEAMAQQAIQSAQAAQGQLGAGQPGQQALPPGSVGGGTPQNAAVIIPPARTGTQGPGTESAP